MGLQLNHLQYLWKSVNGNFLLF